MGRAVCEVCGKRLSYKEKLLAVWVSPMGRMSVECCGVTYAPTLLSAVIFYGLLYISVLPAVISIPAYLILFLPWFLALTFLTPLFTRYRPQRRLGVGDHFAARVLSKITWNAPLGFLYLFGIQYIINFRLYSRADIERTVILIWAGAMAFVILFTFVAAVIRVLLENKRMSSDRNG